MLTFLYDSLETLKKVQVPTKEEIIKLTTIIVILIIVSGLYFAGIDTVFTNIYQSMYNAILF